MKKSSLAAAIALAVAAILLANAGPSWAAGSSTVVSCTPSPVTVGLQQTSCTATVTGSSPTGTVTWSNSGTGSFSPTTCQLSGGACTVGFTPQSTTATSITANYPGDGSNSASTGSTTIAVNQASPSLSGSCTSVVVGSSTTCYATLTGGYSPGGTVTFTQTAGPSIVTLPSPPTCTISSNTCSISVSTTGAGSVTVREAYSGDSNNAATATNVALSVSPHPTTTSASCASQTVVIGQQTTCTATVNGFNPTGTISWAYSGTGTFPQNFCQVPPTSCGVSFFPKSSGTLTATYSGDPNNSGSSGSVAMTANINETIQILVANSAPTTSVSLSGCSVSPTTMPTDDKPHAFQATSGCAGVLVTLPQGAVTRYETAAGQGSLTIPACSSSSCQAFSATIYYQVWNTYQATPSSPSAWAAQGSIAVNGTLLGSGGQILCTINVSAVGSGGFSCSGWGDYNSQVVMGALHISPTERWATAQGPYVDATGGNSHSSGYYSQVLESFQYSLAGSSTAPAAPQLSYTSFGAAAASPLIGSATPVWLDSGSSWSVPQALAGSTTTERWETSVGSGAATSGQTVKLVYYHQYFVTFGFSVVGSGTAFSAPGVSFDQFGAPAAGVQSWADSGSAYNFTNPLVGSTAVERWFTQTPAGQISGAGAVDAVYYHQFAFALGFAVTGGGAYSNPRLNLTSFGAGGLVQLAPSATTFWADSGTSWAVTPMLPSSNGGERWSTDQASSGTAAGPLEMQLTYFHQYAGLMSYSIRGSGGSPPTPRVNYTAYGASSLVPLSKTPGTFWLDSATPWTVTSTLPGGAGERWVSNGTVLAVANGPFAMDAQYSHQFYVAVGVSTVLGGSTTNEDAWYDQGAFIPLNVTATGHWSFEYWRGGTPASYNGTTKLATLTVTGPANETAVFYPGLTIITNSGGAVLYAYGSINGNVPAGTNATVYVPPGRNVTLTAAPSTVEIVFNGWDDAMSGSQLRSSIAISTPATVAASFSTDYVDIRTFSVATIGVFIAASYIFVIKRGPFRKA